MLNYKIPQAVYADAAQGQLSTGLNSAGALQANSQPTHHQALQSEIAELLHKLRVIENRVVGMVERAFGASVPMSAGAAVKDAPQGATQLTSIGIAAAHTAADNINTALDKAETIV